MSTNGLWALGLFLIMSVGFVGPLLWLTARRSRLHDPDRAQVATTVAARVPFDLDVSKVDTSTVFFRFLINGDTDFAYDLVIIGEVIDEDGATTPFAWRTAERTAVPRGQDAEKVTVTHACSMRQGSIALAELSAGAERVRGRVDAGTSNLLVRGWVYVPHTKQSRLTARP